MSKGEYFFDIEVQEEGCPPTVKSMKVVFDEPKKVEDKVVYKVRREIVYKTKTVYVDRPRKREKVKFREG